MIELIIRVSLHQPRFQGEEKRGEEGGTRREKKGEKAIPFTTAVAVLQPLSPLACGPRLAALSMRGMDKGEACCHVKVIFLKSLYRIYPIKVH